jgi:hypothetical protein
MKAAHPDPFKTLLGIALLCNEKANGKSKKKKPCFII